MMKKLIPLLLLAMCLVLTSCSFFTRNNTTGTGTTGAPNDATGTTNDPNSDSTETTTNKNDENPPPAEIPVVDKNTVSSQPLLSIGQAAANTAKDWQFDDADLFDIIKKTLKNGSVSVNVSGDALFSAMNMPNVDAIDATWYTNEIDGNAAEVILTLDGTELPARVWLTNEALAVDGALLFGDANTAYLLGLADLSDEEWLMNMLDVFSQYSNNIPDSSTLTVIWEEIQPVIDAGAELGFDQIGVEWLADAFATIEPTVTEDGENIVVTYTITLDTLATFAKTAVENIEITDEQLAYILSMIAAEGMPDMTVEEARSMVLEAIDTAISAEKENVDFAFDLKVSINQFTNKLSGMGIAFNADPKAEVEDSIQIAMEYLYTDTGLTMSYLAKAGDVDVEETISFDRIVKNDTVSYSVAIDVKTNGDVSDVDLSYTYNKATGAFEAAFSIIAPETDVKLGLKGEITKTENSATIAIKEVSVPQMGALYFNISLTFTKDVPVPSLPENMINVKDFTAEDWEELFAGFGFYPIVPIYGEYEWIDENGYIYTLSFDGTNECAFSIMDPDGNSTGTWPSFRLADGMFTLNEPLLMVLPAATFTFEGSYSFEETDDGLIIDGKLFAPVIYDDGDSIWDTYGITVDGTTIIVDFWGDYLILSQTGEEDLVANFIIDEENRTIALYVEGLEEPMIVSFEMGDGYIVFNGAMLPLWEGDIPGEDVPGEDIPGEDEKPVTIIPGTYISFFNGEQLVYTFTENIISGYAEDAQLDTVYYEIVGDILFFSPLYEDGTHGPAIGKFSIYIDENYFTLYDADTGEVAYFWWDYRNSTDETANLYGEYEWIDENGNSVYLFFPGTNGIGIEITDMENWDTYSAYSFFTLKDGMITIDEATAEALGIANSFTFEETAEGLLIDGKLFAPVIYEEDDSIWGTYGIAVDGTTIIVDFWGDYLILSQTGEEDLIADFIIDAEAGTITLYAGEMGDMTIPFEMGDGYIVFNGIKLALWEGDIPGEDIPGEDVPGEDVEVPGALSGIYLNHPAKDIWVYYTFEGNIYYYFLEDSAETIQEFGYYELNEDQTMITLTPLDDAGDPLGETYTLSLMIQDGYIMLDDITFYQEDMIPGIGEDYTGMILDGYYATKYVFDYGITYEVGYLFEGNTMHILANGEEILSTTYEIIHNWIFIDGAAAPIEIGDGYIIIEIETFYFAELPVVAF